MVPVLRKMARAHTVAPPGRATTSARPAMAPARVHVPTAVSLRGIIPAPPKARRVPMGRRPREMILAARRAR